MADPLYHYTSAEGLHGIISTHSLWAGSINFMNDVREVGYTWDLALEETHRLAEPDGSDGALVAAVEEYSKLTRDPHIAVFSLSEKRDLLSQWRGYAPDGFAIGFDPIALESVAARSGFKLSRCLYQRKEQLELVTPRVAAHLTAFRDSLGSSSDADLIAEEVARNLTIDVLRLSPRLKDPAFEEEKEWRLVSNVIRADEGSWKLRVRGRTISPYVVLDLGDKGASPIRRVMQGPSQNSELAVRALHQLRHTYGVAFDCEASGIPYRTA